MILVGGDVKCWGLNDFGQLGYDSTDNKGDEAGEMAALGTVNLNASAIAITAGSWHTCAILDGGGVKCWGNGNNGRLGYDNSDNKGNAVGDMASLGTVNLGTSALAITAGNRHTCATLDGGGVKCWGGSGEGQLGYDGTDNKGSAAGEMAGLGAVNLIASAIAITAGKQHTCATLIGGALKCWGCNDYGQLGYDSTDNKGDEADEMAGLGTVGVGSSVDTCPLPPSPPPPSPPSPPPSPPPPSPPPPSSPPPSRPPSPPPPSPPPPSPPPPSPPPLSPPPLSPPPLLTGQGTCACADPTPCAHDDPGNDSCHSTIGCAANPKPRTRIRIRT